MSTPTPAPRRFVRMFKPQFADLVRTGKKTQTVRPFPRRMPRIGDTISLRTWSGLPYRSRQHSLGTGEITTADGCSIFDHAIVIAGRPYDADTFARADGFESFAELKRWFTTHHGPLPFFGIVIGWKLNSPTP